MQMWKTLMQYQEKLWSVRGTQMMIVGSACVFVLINLPLTISIHTERHLSCSLVLFLFYFQGLQLFLLGVGGGRCRSISD